LCGEREKEIDRERERERERQKEKDTQKHGGTPCLLEPKFSEVTASPLHSTAITEPP
jgi:hypothetical protein